MYLHSVVLSKENVRKRQQMVAPGEGGKQMVGSSWREMEQMHVSMTSLLVK